jgi:hypothetical protein
MRCLRPGRPPPAFCVTLAGPPGNSNTLYPFGGARRTVTILAIIYSMQRAPTSGSNRTTIRPWNTSWKSLVNEKESCFAAGVARLAAALPPPRSQARLVRISPGAGRRWYTRETVPCRSYLASKTQIQYKGRRKHKTLTSLNPPVLLHNPGFVTCSC